MGSSEGETFLLREPVTVEGPVEGWMTAVEQEMSRSLRSITKEGVYRYASEERQEWITSVLGMVSLVGSQIWWTWEVRQGAISPERLYCVTLSSCRLWLVRHSYVLTTIVPTVRCHSTEYCFASHLLYIV